MASLDVAEQREFPFSVKDFKYLAKLVHEQTGIVLKDHKMNMVYSRLARRLRELHLSSFKEYCGLLQGEGGDQELGSLINAITTNLTRFFRESHHFEHLKDTVFREAQEEAMKSGKNRLRIWSAGCSSGEEPYSIAMSLSAAFPRLGSWDARVLATDLDTTMVARGRSGRYPVSDMETVPASFQKRYFSTAADRSQVIANEQIRKLIAFKQLNLLGSWPMQGPFDAIFCRNVMIYFDEPTKFKLIRRYHSMLKPGGWLYIGHSETLLDAQDVFELTGRTIYRRVT